MKQLEFGDRPRLDKVSRDRLPRWTTSLSAITKNSPPGRCKIALTTPMGPLNQISSKPLLEAFTHQPGMGKVAPPMKASWSSSWPRTGASMFNRGSERLSLEQKSPCSTGKHRVHPVLCGATALGRPLGTDLSAVPTDNSFPYSHHVPVFPISGLQRHSHRPQLAPTDHRRHNPQLIASAEDPRSNLQLFQTAFIQSKHVNRSLFRQCDEFFAASPRQVSKDYCFHGRPQVAASLHLYRL